MDINSFNPMILNHKQFRTKILAADITMLLAIKDNFYSKMSLNQKRLIDGQIQRLTSHIIDYGSPPKDGSY